VSKVGIAPVVFLAYLAMVKDNLDLVVLNRAADGGHDGRKAQFSMLP
jgi:hypothetical protein